MHEGQRKGEEDRPERENRKADKIGCNEGIGDERIFNPAPPFGDDPDFLLPIRNRLLVGHGRGCDCHSLPPIAAVSPRHRCRLLRFPLRPWSSPCRLPRSG
ncbi:hypothetical protein D3C87_1340630 [compost metagenome]